MIRLYTLISFMSFMNFAQTALFCTLFEIHPFPAWRDHRKNAANKRSNLRIKEKLTEYIKVLALISIVKYILGFIENAICKMLTLIQIVLANYGRVRDRRGKSYSKKSSETCPALHRTTSIRMIQIV